MDWLLFIASGFGVFRLTWLITKDRITAAFRREAKKVGKEVGYLAQCPWCASAYVTAQELVLMVWLGMMTWAEAMFWFGPIWGLAMTINQVVVFVTESD